MHLIALNYASGSAEALSNFGLSKTAAFSPAQREQMLAAHRAKPKGIAAVQAQAAPAPAGGAPSSVPHLSNPGGWQPPALGGPGAVAMPGAAGRAMPLEMPLMHGDASLRNDNSLPSRRLPTTMTGAGSIAGQAAQAERRARAVPQAQMMGLPSKLAQFMSS